MQLKTYMKKYFPTIQLIPNLCEQTELSLHMALGDEIDQFTEGEVLNLRRFQVVYEQVAQIFHELCKDDDDIFLVTNVYKIAGDKAKNIKVYRPNVKNKNQLRDLHVQTLPYPLECDGKSEYEMQQFSLACKPRDIQVRKLLKALIHEDFPLKPEFSKELLHYPDVFFVNASRHIIFFVYDDRGCEIVVKDIETLGALQQQFNSFMTN